MQGANVPTNYKEFEELFAEYEAPIFHVLANLQRNIQDAPRRFPTFFLHTKQVKAYNILSLPCFVFFSNTNNTWPRLI